MPTTKIKSSTGKTKFNYTISTPSSSSAKHIDKNLPTLVHIFQRPLPIRRFNCVALDLRVHGHTTGDPIPEGYGAKEAAEDIAKFMDDIKLPACHIVGLSMGTIAAIGLAVHYPNKVASLFLVSPLGLEENTGRRVSRQGQPDMEVLADAVYGALQLGFSNNLDSLANALVAFTLALALKNWGPKHFDQYDRATVEFFNDRKEYSNDELSRIRAPVKLVHCLGDVAYPQEYTEKFMQQLKDAAVTVSLATIPEAPHFGLVTHGDIVNSILHDFTIGSCRTSVPPAPQEVVSPWETELVKAGWDKGGSDSEDD
ncbi:alpha/beta-hydrolase [Armillaria borealis]|uniref:Alpha/beta-hydrolase n=1 Tax=Armillaria borealis TaxID=47425 RepID=A0AA39N096_9AGAR|nr:alpha/beta-hydrolase [Armillaria borealis]